MLRFGNAGRSAHATYEKYGQECPCHDLEMRARVPVLRLRNTGKSAHATFRNAGRSAHATYERYGQECPCHVLPGAGDD